MDGFKSLSQSISSKYFKNVSTNPSNPILLPLFSLLPKKAYDNKQKGFSFYSRNKQNELKRNWLESNWLKTHLPKTTYKLKTPLKHKISTPTGEN